jgi:hypothetical protein
MGATQSSSVQRKIKRLSSRMLARKGPTEPIKVSVNELHAGGKGGKAGAAAGGGAAGKRKEGHSVSSEALVASTGSHGAADDEFRFEPKERELDPRHEELKDVAFDPKANVQAVMRARVASRRFDMNYHLDDDEDD